MNRLLHPACSKLLPIILTAAIPVQAAESTKTRRTGSKTTVTSTRTMAPAPEHFDTYKTYAFKAVREFKGPLSLNRAVEIALQQNPNILNAIEDIRRTRGQIIQVRAQALPQITLVGTYDHQDKRLIESGGGGGGASSGSAAASSAAFTGSSGTTPTGGTTADAEAASEQAAQIEELFSTLQDAAAGGSGSGAGGGVLNRSWRVAVEVRQAIYTGGQVSAAIRIAKLSHDSAYYQLRDVVDRVISDTRTQFYTVLLSRALINVAEEAVRLAEEQLRDQRNRFEAGTVPRFNVLRAEVELANVQPDLIRARNDFLLSKLQLAKTLGLEPGPGGAPGFEPVGSLEISPRNLSIEDSLALARARRAYLKVQRQSILIDTEQIKVEMAGYKPRIDANAGYEIRNRRTSDQISDEINGWFFGFTGSWDIFDGFETYGRVKQARARLQQSKVTYDDSVRQVELEVQTAFANLRQARETIQSQRKNVEQALEALRLSQERLSAGAGTQLEELDARVALTRARTTELQARADYNRALAEYDRTTATETIYDDTFKDPLIKVERGILGRLAETGLPKQPEDVGVVVTPPGRDGKSSR